MAARRGGASSPPPAGRAESGARRGSGPPRRSLSGTRPAQTDPGPSWRGLPGRPGCHLRLRLRLRRGPLERLLALLLASLLELLLAGLRPRLQALDPAAGPLDQLLVVGLLDDLVVGLLRRGLVTL